MKWFLIALPDNLTGSSFTHEDVELKYAVLLHDYPAGCRRMTILNTSRHDNIVSEANKTLYEEIG